MTGTHYPGGISTERTGPLKNFGLPSPASWHVFFDDFDKYAAADWVVTTTEAGAGSATEAIGDGDGGILVLTNAAGDDDRDFLQSVGEGFLFEVGKRLVFEARFKVSDATELDLIMGLQITDTTPNAVSDGVYFRKADNSINLTLHVEKDAVDTVATALVAVEDDTYLTIGFAYDGIAAIEYFVGGERLGSLAVTTMPDDEEMAISFGVQNGEAVAKVMTIDYILAAKER